MLNWLRALKYRIALFRTPREWQFDIVSQKMHRRVYDQIEYREPTEAEFNEWQDERAW